jgi:NTP pyrophosphatase (non-canonical NTP hydrolase)
MPKLQFLRHLVGIREMQVACTADSERWFPHLKDDLKHQVLGLCGEAGELANLIKKWDRGTMSEEELSMLAAGELADILVYLCTTANVLNVDLEKEFNDKRRINDVRFGNTGTTRSTGG